MNEKFKIVARFIKDVSAETPNIETFIFVKDYISKYNLNIDINSKALRDRVIEVNTKLSLSDPNKNEKKSYFEIIFATVIEIDENLKEKDDIEKIILCDLQTKIYPDLEKKFFKLIVDSGYPEPKPNRKVDFNDLYNSKKN
tara:strand:+ start:1145 stop:1567 length:423 start_codon:yes stop_codon:yes gene_type:complete